jgi:hypothetical protein
MSFAMSIFCMFLLGYVLGMFSLLWILGFLDEREDKYAGIVYKKELDTCIDWTLRV